MPRPIYRGNHERIRRELLAALQPGQPCPLCGKPLYPWQKLHLAHADDESGHSIPGRYIGLVHAGENMAANSWNWKGRKAAAEAEGTGPSERQQRIAARDARRQRRKFRAEFDAVQEQNKGREWLQRADSGTLEPRKSRF